MFICAFYFSMNKQKREEADRLEVGGLLGGNIQ